MKSFSCFKPRDPFKNWSKELDKRVAIWAKNFDSSFKLLLLGPAGAGKTTILKQMKIIHFEGFSLEERQQKAKEIRANLLESVRELTACITSSGHQINWSDKENQTRLDFINGLNLDDQTYDLYAAKIYDYSKRILTDKGVEELFAQLNQLSITHRSQYLLNRVDEIRNVDYIPNNDDILQSRRKTSDIQKLEFQVELPVKSGANIKQTFCMFDVGGQRGERRKWIQVFDGVTAVMFLIDSSSFDAIDDENGRNKLRETINLFHEVWTTRFLLNSHFVLLFNKQDVLRKKIERGHRIEDHFPEFKLYKFQHQDRPVHGRSGEKLNLFRSSSSRSARSTARCSCSASPTTTCDTGGGGGGRGSAKTPLCSTSSVSTAAAAATADAVSNQIHRDKRKTRSLYRFGTSSRSKQKASQAAPTAAAEAPPAPFNQYQSSPLISTNTATSNPNCSDPKKILSAPLDTANQESIHHHHHHQKESSDQHRTGQCELEIAHANHLAFLKARSFIRDKFLQITRQTDQDLRKFSSQNLPMYNTKASRIDQPKRNVCYHYTTATDTENIRDLFENLQKMVLKSIIKDV